MKPFINYLGGKQRLAKKLISYFPEHKCYVEVFGGSGAVLFAKEPSQFEKYNDIDDELVNLFRQVRENADQLSRKIALLPQSRSEYNRLRKSYNDLSDVDRAVRTYYLFSNGYSGKPDGGFSASAHHKGKYRMITDFDNWSRRLDRVTIENFDFAKLIDLYDNPSTFFFLDPPYLDKPKYYAHNFDSGDHRRLRDKLCSVEGKWLLLYDDCEEVRALYDGFYIQPLDVIYSAHRNGKNGAELIISNYRLEERK